MILLAWMATGYKYVDYTTGEGVTKDLDDDDNKDDDEDDEHGDGSGDGIDVTRKGSSELRN